jgi:hypothetical protein
MMQMTTGDSSGTSPTKSVDSSSKGSGIVKNTFKAARICRSPKLINCAVAIGKL